MAKNISVRAIRLPVIRGASKYPVPSSLVGREPRTKPTRIVRHMDVAIPRART
jgi:hypothetical protein